MAGRGHQYLVATKHFVDTHSFLWFVAGSDQLGAEANEVFQDPSSQLFIPAIVLAEALWIAQHGRVKLTIEQLMSAVDRDPRIEIVHLDRKIIERSCTLTNINEMHDRQIVATVLVFQDIGETVDLLTRDSNITASELVEVVW